MGAGLQRFQLWTLPEPYWKAPVFFSPWLVWSQLEDSRTERQLNFSQLQTGLRAFYLETLPANKSHTRTIKRFFLSHCWIVSASSLQSSMHHYSQQILYNTVHALASSIEQYYFKKQGWNEVWLFCCQQQSLPPPFLFKARSRSEHHVWLRHCQTRRRWRPIFPTWRLVGRRASTTQRWAKETWHAVQNT